MRLSWTIHVASQGKFKDVKKYVEKLKPKKEQGREDLLKDFRKGNTRG